MSVKMKRMSKQQRVLGTTKHSLMTQDCLAQSAPHFLAAVTSNLLATLQSGAGLGTSWAVAALTEWEGEEVHFLRDAPRLIA